MSLIWTANHHAANKASSIALATDATADKCPTCGREQPGDKAQCDGCQKAHAPEPAPICPDPECNGIAMVQRECPVCDGAGGGKNNWGSASLDDGAWDCDFCDGEGKFWQCPECGEPGAPLDPWEDY